MSALGIIPTYVRKDSDLAVTVKTIETLREHEPDLETLIVDDCSPNQDLADALEQRARELRVHVSRQTENRGFSHTVNVGLERALVRGQDAILINADIEFTMPFVSTFEQTEDSQGRPAAVVGALLLYPNGLIQSAGTYLSFSGRFFDHLWRYGPGALPEAQVPRVCLVTAALQYIRHSTLETVGLYDDENFRMGWEDVDHGLRVFETGLECVYQPAVKAIHHESMFRGQNDDKLSEWQQVSLTALYEKHAQTPLGRYVPPIA